MELGFEEAMVDKALALTNDKEKAAELIVGFIEDSEGKDGLDMDEAFKESLKGLAGIDPNSKA